MGLLTSLLRKAIDTRPPLSRKNDPADRLIRRLAEADIVVSMILMRNPISSCNRNIQYVGTYLDT